MLIKIKPQTMEVIKNSLTPRAKCTLVDLLNKRQRKDCLSWYQDDRVYTVAAKPDELYYVIYNLTKNFDVELM